MLKIKDNVNLKELEKFGFKRCSNSDEYVLHFARYVNGKVYSYIVITKTRRISCLNYVAMEHEQRAVEVLFDLIQAGLVKKVEDHYE